MLLKKIQELARFQMASQHKNNEISSVPITWKVFDERELEYMIEAVLDCHWTWWRWEERFENSLAQFLWIKHVITTNSGSSANLLALTTLTAKELGNRRLRPWDEVITVAAGFPTTIAPIIQNWLTPVFVDVDIGTYQINIDSLKNAITPKTKAIMIAHTLWNTFNLTAIKAICLEFTLWLIEDNCDALGSKYDWQYTWTFGDISTLSFYPAHHITMGEGWALLTKSSFLAKIIRSYRDWWRDCWCKTWMDNTCQARYQWKLGDLPAWFDHKYIYSRIGYNLKITDIQAALGVAQLEKLESFILTRKNNFAYLKKQFLANSFDRYFILPDATPNSDPSWFGFPLSLRQDVKFTRKELITFLNKEWVATRLLFAWNFIKQPAFLDYVREYRVVWELRNSDYIMDNTFWVWVYPALDFSHLDFLIAKFQLFLDEHNTSN